MKYRYTEKREKFDHSDRKPGIIYYPTRKQLFINNRVVDIYSLLGDHLPTYRYGASVFDAKTGQNSISLGYFESIEAAQKRALRHFEQHERGDTWRWVCKGQTCCKGEPQEIEAFTLGDAILKAGAHWTGRNDFVLIRQGVAA